MEVEISKLSFSSFLTFQWYWDLNSNYCSVWRDFKFAVPSNVLMTYNALSLADYEELKICAVPLGWH
jgi:hypothetical protein